MSGCKRHIHYLAYVLLSLRMGRYLLSQPPPLAAAQGWGNLANTAVICALLSVFGQAGGPSRASYDRSALTAVWRLSFTVGLLPVAGMMAYRLIYVTESELWSCKARSPEARHTEGLCMMLFLEYCSLLRSPAY